MRPAGFDIDEQAIDDFCRKHGVARLALFGSVLRTDFNPTRSDIDMLVEFLPGANRSLFKLLEMQNELAGMFGRNVDLNTPGSLSKYFRDEVVAKSEVLYDAA